MYRTSFEGHVASLRLAASPWADPVGRAIIQQHRGRWCGSLELLQEGIAQETQDLERLLHRLQAWDKTQLDVPGAAQLARADVAGRGLPRRQGAALDYVHEQLQCNSPGNEGSAQVVASLRAENDALTYGKKQQQQQTKKV